MSLGMVRSVLIKAVVYERLSQRNAKCSFCSPGPSEYVEFDSLSYSPIE